MAEIHAINCICERCERLRARQTSTPVLTKQKLEWIRLDKTSPIDSDGDLYRLLIQHTTEGIAVDFKVGMKVEEVIGGLHHAVALLKRRCRVEPEKLAVANHVNTARLVRSAASVPEICMHNVKLGQGCFCPNCPTASYDESTVVPQLPTGALTPELLAECRKRCKEAGLEFVEPPAEPMPFKDWAADMRTQSMQSTLQAYKAKIQKLEYELACRPEQSENRTASHE